MKKGKLHFVAVTALMIFVVLGLASTCGTTPEPTREFVTGTSSVTSLMFKDGQIFEVGVVPVKDFTTAGLIFVASTAKYDSNGRIIEGSKITFDMLMREAQRLNADAIINIKLDETHRFIETEEVRTTSRRNPNTGVIEEREERVIVLTKEVEYKANALAIRYTSAVLIPAANNSREFSNAGETNERALRIPNLGR
jgi:hypothetical protein